MKKKKKIRKKKKNIKKYKKNFFKNLEINYFFGIIFLENYLEIIKLSRDIISR